MTARYSLCPAPSAAYTDANWNPAYSEPFSITVLTPTDGQILRITCDREFVQGLYDQLGMVLQQQDQEEGRDWTAPVLHGLAQAAGHQKARDDLAEYRERYLSTPTVANGL
jgi:hypothetical protein